MGKINIGLTVLLAGVFLIPAATYGQDYSPPETVFPLPLYHDRPETGGLFVAGEFVFFRQTNPLKHQLIARRGLVDADGSISADQNGSRILTTNSEVIIPGQAQPGRFLGSGTPALYADDAGGPGSYQPGFNATIGWRFRSGVVLEFTYTHWDDARYFAGATLVPPNFAVGQDLADTFLFSPVTNFPSEFAGPSSKLALGSPTAGFGIWNGASLEQISFIQRFDQYNISGRIPICETDSFRAYGLLGPRIVAQWERFKWRTVSQQFDGTAEPTDVAIYSNVVSNRMYGVHLGGGNEWRLGDTPIGTFSVSVEAEAAFLVDIVKEEAKYERGDRAISAKRSRNDYTLVPELQANANLWWYPIEGVQIRVGYDVMTFFNTVSSPNPVSFNFSNLDPPWEKGTFRLMDGFNAGIGFIF